ncbi:hypothetical protein KDN34_04900 [Shewanella yunxiaonensis]|uniref:Uncharacterized protein n=1 Tax=Shewanella yunxiaonensis TaxID=2829809 RepID=A0ABX7YVP7_9GAMM|nr:hypothetical protein [Shewanella yunxiaonensis]QUN06792.1 hypothetical protein KDN34_04900 [Shewanella yunxiaonensis]
MVLQIVIALLFITSCFINVRKRSDETEVLQKIGESNLEIEMLVQQGLDRLTDEGAVFLWSANGNKGLNLALTANAVAQLKEQGIINPASYFLHKKVAVSGAVMKLNGQHLLPIQAADQIQILS